MRKAVEAQVSVRPAAPPPVDMRIVITTQFGSTANRRSADERDSCVPPQSVACSTEFSVSACNKGVGGVGGGGVTGRPAYRALCTLVYCEGLGTPRGPLGLWHLGLWQSPARGWIIRRSKNQPSLIETLEDWLRMPSDETLDASPSQGPQNATTKVNKQSVFKSDEPEVGYLHKDLPNTPSPKEHI